MDIPRNNIWLAVEPTPLKQYELVNWDDDYSQDMDKTCSKPPTKQNTVTTTVPGSSSKVKMM